MLCLLLVSAACACRTESPAPRPTAPAPPPPAEAAPDSPEEPKDNEEPICLVYPHRHAVLKTNGRRDTAAAQAAYEEGLALAAKGDHAGALAAYRRALAADPVHGLTHLEKAQSHLLSDYDVEKMRRHLATAVVLLPKNPRAHLRLANFAADVGETSVAVTHWRCALELKPSYAEARFFLARYLVASGRAAEAETELRRVLADGKRTVATLVLLAEAMEAQGKLLEAAQLIEEAAREAKTSAVLYRRAGALYESASSPMSARRVRAKADRLDPPPKSRRMRPLRKRRRRR